MLLTLNFPNRIPNRLDQVNLLVMRQSSELRQPVDCPKENVWWKIEWRQCEADVDDVRMCPAHQLNADSVANSIQSFESSLLSLRFLNERNELFKVKNRNKNHVQISVNVPRGAV